MGRHAILGVMALGAVLPALRAATPNIVVILADDLGWGDVGCYGATKVKTPNIDRLAKEGVRFTDAHSCTSVCSPTRYGLLTGRYPWRTKQLEKGGVLHAHDGLIIEPDRLTLASLLKAQGYTTACVGKWHLGLGDPKPDWNGVLKPGPLEVGFDYYFGVPTVNSEEPCVFVENHRIVGLDPKDPITMLTNERMAGGKAARYEHGRLDGPQTEKAVAWLEKAAAGKKPFFLYFCPCSIHDPVVPAAKFKGTSDSGPRGDFIHEHDWCVGEILKTLDRLKRAEDTLVIYTSDNGGLERHLEHTPPEGIEAKYSHKVSGDWRGQKTDLWEGGHRVPFVARWPGHIKPGTRSDEMICLNDVVATVAAILEVKLPAGAAPDSFNILPALLGHRHEPGLRPHLVMNSLWGMYAVRQGPWKLILTQGSGGISSNNFVYKRPAKPVPPDPALPAGQLYNLADDPRERTNRYAKEPEQVRRLTGLLEKIRGQE